MRKIECPSTKEPTEMQPAQEQPHPVITTVTQPDQDSCLQHKSAECLNENPEEAAMYKRGDNVFIKKDGKATRAMVCEITPQKSA